MLRLLSVMFAGGLGCGTRYLVAQVMEKHYPGWMAGTLLVNVVGSALLAFLMLLSTRSSLLPEVWRLALTTGFLGGLTTYSTFNFEALKLFEQGRYQEGSTYVLITLVACMLAGVAGWSLAVALSSHLGA